MSWIKSKANWALLFASLLFSLLAFELAYKLILKPAPEHSWDNRYMLFQSESGKVFQNLDAGFVYAPGQRIRSTTYYRTGDSWHQEYDYVIPTNNAGLVQSTDLVPGKPAMLLLGDSFTEGQGAAPWFDKLASSLNSPRQQLVNGGLLGTGFQQWVLLRDHLERQGLPIEKLVVIFISDDYNRAVWQLPQAHFECLSDYRKCSGKESFFARPPESELESYLEQLRLGREAGKDGGMLSTMRDLFPATRLVIRYVRESLKSLRHKASGNRPDSEQARNLQAIQTLIAKHGNDLLFIHLPQKEEVTRRIISGLGRQAIADIQAAGGQIFDGHRHCGLAPTDFYDNDAHPNAAGYAKIAACVETAIKGHWPNN